MKEWFMVLKSNILFPLEALPTRCWSHTWSSWMTLSRWSPSAGVLRRTGKSYWPTVSPRSWSTSCRTLPCLARTHRSHSRERRPTECTTCSKMPTVWENRSTHTCITSAYISSFYMLHLLLCSFSFLHILHSYNFVLQLLYRNFPGDKLSFILSTIRG